MSVGAAAPPGSADLPEPLGREALEARREELARELGEEITLDGLTAAWSIFQRRRGHRHSTDDLVTGWYALEMADRFLGAPPSHALDLGTGIGTVGLLVLSGLLGRDRSPRLARLTCIEAQTLSHRFLLENVRANGLERWVEPHLGDLRDLALSRRFPLVTGSPPYFDVGAGIVPADAQKAHARFELRGDVRDYARVARAHLDDDGLFVLCFPYPQRERALAAARGEGMAVVCQREVVPRAGLAPLFSVLACRPGVHPEVVEPPLVVRHEDGTHTDAMHALRARFGWPPGR